MRRSITNLLARKLITMPRLSPTHTSARLVQRLVPSGSHVVEYQPVMTVQCSSDMISDDPAYRISPEHQPMMLIESMEEGRIEWNEETEVIDRNELLNVGTALGKIDDGDDDGDEEEWTWQAYFMTILKERVKPKILLDQNICLLDGFWTWSVDYSEVQVLRKEQPDDEEFSDEYEYYTWMLFGGGDDKGF
eukprot:CAMPEP_0201901542 /NCGR_PEP_ID=MMETSP0902-20130614/54486_1 /ASSEMBLY_ACC=CAM_ASM_000551 /TAXON_ID=420261 /ORGANISM="Thalassiosira antarctica, Strain CCMP982" /LENGTH=190 /DNA_ID=CAMNT_0048435505 /DNA_START=54 /DNA_END=627 /DNA_ORIENTATION=-